MKGSKFIQNAIDKQDMAYNLMWASKQFSYSCERCASTNLLHQCCETCPIKEAYLRAMFEINHGMRSKPREWNKEGLRVSKDRHGHITLTLNNCQNITININGKEVDIDK